MLITEATLLCEKKKLFFIALSQTRLQHFGTKMADTGIADAADKIATNRSTIPPTMIPNTHKDITYNFLHSTGIRYIHGSHRAEVGPI